VHVSLFNAMSLMIQWHYHKEILQFNRTTNSMEHSPKVSPSLESNLHIIEANKVHTHVHECSLIATNLSHMNPVHAFPSYFLKNHFNILPTCRFSKWSHFLRPPIQNPVYTFPLPTSVSHAPSISFFLILQPT